VEGVVEVTLEVRDGGGYDGYFSYKRVALLEEGGFGGGLGGWLGGAGCHGIGRKEVHSLCLVERIGGRW